MVKRYELPDFMMGIDGLLLLHDLAEEAKVEHYIGRKLVPGTLVAINAALACAWDGYILREKAEYLRVYVPCVTAHRDELVLNWGIVT